MPEDRINLRLGHSPDPDDAFMWWPLFKIDGSPPRLETGRFTFEPVREDIERLNQRSNDGDLEITAISVAQYSHIKERYAFTSCGSSMGDDYGPKLVAREPMSLQDLIRPGVVTAVPGERTSAFGAMSLMLGKDVFGYEVVDFEDIIARVAGGDFQAGLIIHEGQLTFEQSGLHQIVDMGHWWTRRKSLPLPLGGNVIRRDLEQTHGVGTLENVTTLLAASLEYALANRAESIAYALGYARDMGAELADKFVSMYVNKWTLDFGERGREAVRSFLADLHEVGLTPDPGEIDFIRPHETSTSLERAD